MPRPNCETTRSAAGLLKTPRRTLFMPSPSSPLSPCRPSPSSSPISETVRCRTMLPSPPRSPPDFLVPKRLFKPIPLNLTGEEGRNTRRRLFLKKVRDSRETKMMNARGGQDEMMRMIFVAEHQRWEASLKQAASRIPTIYEEEEEDMSEYSENILVLASESEIAPAQLPEPPTPLDDFDELLDRDGQELEGLLSQMDLDMDDGMVCA